MRKLSVIAVILLLSLSIAGCNKNEAVEYDVVDVLMDVRKDGDYNGPLIDSMTMDIDHDGIAENCSILVGPTSGLNSIVITASVDGVVKYKDLYTWAPRETSFEISFANTDDAPCVVVNGENHKLSISNNHIMIEDWDK